MAVYVEQLIAVYNGTRVRDGQIGYDLFRILSDDGRIRRFHCMDMVTDRNRGRPTAPDAVFEDVVMTALRERLEPLLAIMEHASPTGTVDLDIVWTLEAEVLPACIVDVCVPRPNLVPARVSIFTSTGRPDQRISLPREPHPAIIEDLDLIPA